MQWQKRITTNAPRITTQKKQARTKLNCGNQKMLNAHKRHERHLRISSSHAEESQHGVGERAKVLLGVQTTAVGSAHNNKRARCRNERIREAERKERSRASTKTWTTDKKCKEMHLLQEFSDNSFHTNANVRSKITQTRLRFINLWQERATVSKLTNKQMWICTETRRRNARTQSRRLNRQTTSDK